MTTPSGAKFTISASPSTDRGYDATASETLTLQLEASPALDVRSCRYDILRMTKDGPSLTISASGVASPPTAAVTLALPAGNDVYAFVIRCKTNGGEAVKVNGKPDYTINTFERIVAVRSSEGHRKIVEGETYEYEFPFGWTQAHNELVDASNRPRSLSVHGSIETTDDTETTLLEIPFGDTAVLTGTTHVLALGPTAGLYQKASSGGVLVTNAGTLAAPAGSADENEFWSADPDPAPSFTVDYDSGSKKLRLRVTGLAATSFSWAARIDGLTIIT